MKLTTRPLRVIVDTWSLLFSGTFTQTAGILGASNIIAQIIGLASIIILDRVTAQQSIGIYIEFIAITTVLLPIGLLSLHLAIPGMSPYRTAQMAVALTFIGTGTALLTGIASYLVNYTFWLELTVIVFVGNCTQLADQINLNKVAFKGMLLNRIIGRATFVALLPLWTIITSGYISAEWIIHLYVATTGIFGILYFLVTARSIMKSHQISALETWRETIKLTDYPIYVAPSQILNALAHNIPVILISGYFGPVAAAQYGITLRFCFSPIQLLAGSVNQAIHFEFARILTRDPSTITQRFFKIYKPIALTAAGLLVILVFIMPSLLVTLMGDEWQDAGTMIRILAPMYSLMLIAASLGTIFIVLGERQYLFATQLQYFIISCVSFGYAVVAKDIWAGIIIYAILSSFRYIMILRKMHALMKNNY